MQKFVEWICCLRVNKMLSGCCKNSHSWLSRFISLIWFKKCIEKQSKFDSKPLCTISQQTTNPNLSNIVLVHWQPIGHPHYDGLSPKVIKSCSTNFFKVKGALNESSMLETAVCPQEYCSVVAFFLVCNWY